MCSGTQPKLFGGAQPLGSGGNFQAPITYQGGIPQNFDAGDPSNFPKPVPPQPPVPRPPMPNPRFRWPFSDYPGPGGGFGGGSGGFVGGLGSGGSVFGGPDIGAIRRMFTS